MTGNFPSVFPITVYGDSLASDWLDWSWGGARTFNNASPVKVGASSVKVNFTSAYGGFSLRKGTVIKAAGYTSLKFWAYGASGAHPLLAYLETADTGGETVKVSVSAPANGWTEFHDQSERLRFSFSDQTHQFSVAWNWRRLFRRHSTRSLISRHATNDRFASRLRQFPQLLVVSGETSVPASWNSNLPLKCQRIFISKKARRGIF